MRLRLATLSTTALLALQPLTAFAQQESFLDWMAQYAELRAEALDAIDLYLKVTVLEGLVLPDAALPPELGKCQQKLCQGIKVERTATLPDGSTRVIGERLLSPMELGVLTGNTSSAFLQAMGQGMITAQFQLNQALGGGPTPTEFAEELDEDPVDGDDVLRRVLDPTRILYYWGAMAVDAAQAAGEAEESLRNGAALAQADTDQAYDAFGQLAYAGRVDYGGTTAVAFQAPDLDWPIQDVDGEEATLTSATILVDPEKHRFLKQRMEGAMTAQGQSREFFIEIENTDFRNPPGCGLMDEPYRRVMRMGGMLDEAQMAQMEEARAQLAEFEQQMATMPPDQRAMMERMMGSQLEMMRGLVNGGVIERVEQVEEIICNPDLASLFSIGGTPAESDEALVRRIQEYLVILGYEPGNIEGVLDTLTQVAISQFQAEHALEVTGEPSAELAGVLAELVEA